MTVDKVISMKQSVVIGILSGLLSAILVIIPAAILTGEFKEKITSTENDLSYHVHTYTPDIVKDYQATKTIVAVHDARLKEVDKALDEIKAQNVMILGLLRAQNKAKGISGELQ